MQLKVHWAFCVSLVGGAIFAMPALADEYAAGLKYLSAKDFQHGAQYFEAAMRANPAHSTALYYDAVCYQQLGQHERAKALYQLLLSVFPKSPAAVSAERALKAMGVGRPLIAAAPASAAAPAAPPPADAAEPTEESLIDQECTSARNLADAGRTAEAEKHLIDAERRAEHLGSVNGKLCAVLAQLGDLYAARGDNTRACRLYKRELQINEQLLGRNNPILADRLVVQANAFRDDGDYTQAETLLRRSMDFYQTAINNGERNRLNTKPDSDKLVGAMSSLANVLRLSGHGGEAKVLEGQVRMMTVH